MFDSENDYLTGCQNVSHCQQQSCSELLSPEWSYSLQEIIVFQEKGKPEYL